MNVSSSLTKLNVCLQEVQKWMAQSKLKLNPEKTEFIVFGSKLATFFPANILGNLINPADAVRNLGVWFDADFSFS